MSKHEIPSESLLKTRNFLSSSHAVLSRLCGHQLIKPRIPWELIDKGHKGAPVLYQAAPCVRIGDIAHLLVGDVQKLCQFLLVGCRLIEHHDKLAVGKHGAGKHGIQQILHVLGNGVGKGVSFPEAPPF